MIDLSKTILAKSDDITADDLIDKCADIIITKVTVNNTERPVVIECTGFNGKVFIPCKTMRRVLVAVWGNNGEDYIGKGLRLYRDKNVKYAGVKVGGVRISHMTNIDAKREISLTISRAVKYVFTIQPLVIEANSIVKKGETSIDAIYKEISNCLNVNDIKKIYNDNINSVDFEKISRACTARKEAIIGVGKKINNEFNDALYGE